MLCRFLQCISFWTDRHVSLSTGSRNKSIATEPLVHLHRFAQMSTAQPLKKLVSGVVLDLDGTLLNTGHFLSWFLLYIVSTLFHDIIVLSPYHLRLIHEMNHACHLCTCMCFLCWSIYFPLVISRQTQELFGQEAYFGVCRKNYG